MLEQVRAEHQRNTQNTQNSSELREGGGGQVGLWAVELQGGQRWAGGCEWVWWRAVLVQGRSELGQFSVCPCCVLVLLAGRRSHQGAGREDGPAVFRVFSAL